MRPSKSRIFDIAAFFNATVQLVRNFTATFYHATFQTSFTPTNFNQMCPITCPSQCTPSYSAFVLSSLFHQSRGQFIRTWKCVHKPEWLQAHQRLHQAERLHVRTFWYHFSTLNILPLIVLNFWTSATFYVSSLIHLQSHRYPLSLHSSVVLAWHLACCQRPFIKEVSGSWNPLEVLSLIEIIKIINAEAAYLLALNVKDRFSIYPLLHSSLIPIINCPHCLTPELQGVRLYLPAYWTPPNHGNYRCVLDHVLNFHTYLCNASFSLWT